jgi:hypothetical protein
MHRMPIDQIVQGLLGEGMGFCRYFYEFWIVGHVLPLQHEISTDSDSLTKYPK